MSISVRMFLLVIMAASVVSASAQTKIIAHRGYWDTGGTSQNSMASLKNAAEAGVYGSEFDVVVTKDGIPLVNHNSRIKLKKVEKHNYSKFKDRRLSNGETLSTLREYLDEGVKYPGLKLVLEVKSASTPELEREWVKTILSVVRESGAEAQVEYIAFSLNVLKELVDSGVTVPIAYLKGDLSPGELAALGITGIDYNIKVLKSNPEWITQAQGLGMPVNVWTVNKEPDMKWLVSQGVDFITTDNPLLLREVVSRFYGE